MQESNNLGAGMDNNDSIVCIIKTIEYFSNIYILRTG